MLHLVGSVEPFLALALNMPTYTAAYNDATVDGLSRLAEVMGVADGGITASAEPASPVGW